MKTYRFEIRVANALDYLSDKFAHSLDLSTNTISGWIKESMVEDLRNHFTGMEISLTEASEYNKR